MIFICTGTQIYQFNRLIKKLDELIESEVITDDVVAQIGNTTYLPKNMKWKHFMDKDEFDRYQNEASLIVSHAGTGALIGALKKGKQVISVPRLAEFHEHSDNHQLQVSSVLAKEGYLREVKDMEKLGETIILSQTQPVKKKYAIPSMVIETIDRFICENIKM